MVHSLLGMAQLNYDKLKRQTKKKRDKGLLEIERKEVGFTYESIHFMHHTVFVTILFII